MRNPYNGTRRKSETMRTKKNYEKINAKRDKEKERKGQGKERGKKMRHEKWISAFIAKHLFVHLIFFTIKKKGELKEVCRINGNDYYRI